MTNKSMDIFGEALHAYSLGDRSVFYLEDERGRKHIYNLAERFRSYSSLNNSEKKLIHLSHGDILDIGCGTGNVIPALSKKGTALGIDISKKVIDVAHASGCANCIVADIFKFKPNKKFDTITLFGNDLGIGGTVNNTKKLLKVLKHLLKPNGQVLAITRNFNRSAYAEMKLIPIWKNKRGAAFRWLIFEIDFLSSLCEKERLQIKILSKSWKYRLIKISKKIN